ncbi:ABC transporter permease [Cohnella hashimotonis]|uniref:Transport permease protein n=1 Tax=Cohnella hashimotonis TaxID=2826895 RepID=A0ABT6TU92_9BACL|nr:ABC transporter permease [Cohnella hashimotonis]MDI4650294.1 ABC transporter permease [Cohnella hashimotonis]
MHVGTTLRSLYSNKFLIRNFVLKELKNKYAGSFLGFLWSLVHPLTIMGVYSVVFSWMLKTRLGEEVGTSNFPVWLYAGLLPWTLFAESLSRATSSVLDHANLIKKTIFPSEILPVALLLANCVNFLIGLTILLCFNLIVGGSFTWGVFLIGVYFIPLFLLTLGMSWIVSCLNVYFRDMGQLVGVFVNIWFYATTIIYPLSVVPQRLHPYFQLNPLVQVVEGFRSALFKGQLISDNKLIYLYASSFVLFIVGQFLFQKTKKGFVDVI